jgi:anaerobic selenocysteine-containing dehydrogenase
LYDTDEELVRAALSSEHPWLQGITFERLWQAGWVNLNIPSDWLRFANGGFPTVSGKCELFSEDLAARGFDPLPAYTPVGKLDLADKGRYPLSLVSAKTELHFLNSSYANLPRQLRAAGEPRLAINSTDAQRRGIANGTMVRIFNDRAHVTARASVGEYVPEGTVSLPSGWWASLSPGGAAVNALTADGLSDWGGGGDFHDTFVDVTSVQPTLGG